MNKEQIKRHPGFIPYQLKHHQLRNRFVVAPMSRVSASEKGVPTENMKRYYSSFAEGGFSMIISEGLYTDLRYSKAYPKQPGIVTPPQLEKWAELTSAIKERPVVLIAQLMHAGSISQCLPVTKAPSSVLPLGEKMKEYGGGEGAFPVPEEMTAADIYNVIEGFVLAAQNAVATGFHGVEIHAANGYLLDQFLTSYTNQRTDEWGGDVSRRFKIIHQIITGIKQSVPQHFIVGLRLSEGKVNNLYYRWPEGKAMAKAILNEVNNVKPDYVHIAAESGNWQRDCTYEDGSSYSGLARQITGLPVIANGGLHQLDISEKILTNGDADLLALGSAALADPFWPNKVVAGIEADRFARDLIKPLATIEHTWKMQGKLLLSNTA
jgi:2,4-dienoyl-CoA reductase-like NADH-dependent reductase (Old Yellow Enzyme family)